MKSTASMHSYPFFNSALPIVAPWGESRRRIIRKPQPLQASTLDLDQLASATKQEVVCAVILALCLLFTIGSVLAQLAA